MHQVYRAYLRNEVQGLFCSQLDALFLSRHVYLFQNLFYSNDRIFSISDRPSDYDIIGPPERRIPRGYNPPLVIALNEGPEGPHPRDHRHKPPSEVLPDER